MNMVNSGGKPPRYYIIKTIMRGTEQKIDVVRSIME